MSLFIIMTNKEANNMLDVGSIPTKIRCILSIHFFYIDAKSGQFCTKRAASPTLFTQNGREHPQTPLKLKVSTLTWSHCLISYPVC